MASTKNDVRIFNQHLKFSWSNIISFIGLIAAAYITFMGFTYMTGGLFWLAGVATAVVVALLAWAFVGAQQLKATDERFARCIRRERVLLCLTPYVLAVAMWPMSHFWAVRSHDAEIVSLFTGSIGSSRQLFTDYENYCHRRIDDYRSGLERLAASRDTQHARYNDAGFGSMADSVHIANMVRTLELQLLSDNYMRLRDEADDWITEASRGASTWNIFLIGNTRQIKDAVTRWHDRLDAMSSVTMRNEQLLLLSETSFADTDNSLATVTRNIDTVSDSYRSAGGGLVASLSFGALLYVLLIFPYLLQGRNSRSMVTLTGHRSSLGTGHDDGADPYGVPLDDNVRDTAPSSGAADDDDYQIF